MTDEGGAGPRHRPGPGARPAAGPHLGPGDDPGVLERIPVASAGARRATEERFRTSVEALLYPFGLYTALRDDTGRIVDFRIDYVNGAMCRLNSVPRERQVGQTLLDLFPAHRPSGLFDAFCRVVETGEPLTLNGLVYRDPRARGGGLDLVIDLHAVRLGDGYVVTGHEVSERNRAELELREAEERYRVLVEQIPAIVFIDEIAPDGSIRPIYVSPQVEATLGYPQADWLADPALTRRLIHPEDRDRVVAELDRRHAAGEPFVAEYRMIARDGRVVWVHDSDLGTTTGPGGVPRLQGVVFDVTALRRTEEERGRLAAAIEQGVEAIVITDPDGRIVYVNPAFERLSGYSGAEAVGRQVGEIDGATGPPELHEAMRAALARGEAWSGEVVNTRRDGTPYTAEMAITPIRADGGRVTDFVSIRRDVTRERELEAQLRQAQKMEAVGRLAGGIAHDFNNLLSAVIGFSELVMADLPLGDRRRDDLAEVVRAAQRAADLTRQLLAFGRRQLLRPQVLDLNTLVREVEPMLRRTIGEDVELVIAAEPGLASVRADAGQLEQVILNLAINALDAMPGGGRLTVETAEVLLDEVYVRRHAGATAGPHVVLTVADTGVGMDNATQARIFEPFFTTKSEGKGTGLGLSTVYGIVKQSGGYISVDSEPGRGSTLRIYLPRVDESAEPYVLEASPASSAGGSETVLVVDDSDAVRSAVGSQLERRGYRVLSAASGEDALEVAGGHEGTIDLLLSDVVMPGMSGPELAERLAVTRPGLRVLFMSGYAADAIAERGVLDAGAAHLPKPIGAALLASRVREALDTPRSG